MAFLDEVFGNGGAAATDRNNTLGAYGRLNSDSDFLSSLGKQNDTSSAAYFQKIMAGDPTAIAPEANALNDQANQQKNAIVMNGNRTGGNNAQIQDLSANVGGQVADALLKSQTGAATTLGQQGQSESGQGIGAAEDVGGLSTQNHSLDAQLHQQKIDTYTKALASYFTGS